MRKVFENPPPARLLIAVMWQPQISESLVEQELEKAWGKICLKSGVFDFKHTQYYAPEMGERLKKCFYEIEGLFLRDSLVDQKLRATETEDFYMLSNHKRQINLDPMFLSLENLVISTSKNFSHRIYLGEGIFGDLALIRRSGRFETFAWTYPDYIEHLEFFEKVREGLKENLGRREGWSPINA